MNRTELAQKVAGSRGAMRGPFVPAAQPIVLRAIELGSDAVWRSALVVDRQIEFVRYKIDDGEGRQTAALRRLCVIHTFGSRRC